MATIKLKKKDPAAASRPARPSRPPVRGAGSAPRKRLTLEEAQAEREAREARARTARAERPAPQEPPRPGPAPRNPRSATGPAPRKGAGTGMDRKVNRNIGKKAPPGAGRDGTRPGTDPSTRPSTDSSTHPSTSPHGSPRPGTRGPNTAFGPAPAPRRDRAHPPPSAPAPTPSPARHRPPAPTPASAHGAPPRPVRAAPEVTAPRRGPHPQANTRAKTIRPAPHPTRGGPPSAAPTPQRPAPGARPADDSTGLRLSKRMSELGLASRREADEWIAKGWVRVDDQVVSTLGARVQPEQRITIDARAKHQQAQRVTVLLHKPVGYVSGQAEDGYEPARVLVAPQNQWREDRSGIRFLREHLRSLVPAGRLDIDSVGLLVLTQDGRVAKQLIGEGTEVDKEYLVRVQSLDGQPLPDDRLALLRHGLSLDGEPLRPAQVEWINEDQLRFVLREGKKRQIRRMCEAVGLKVTGLKRVRIGPLMLGDLPSGQWRYLRPDEMFALTQWALRKEGAAKERNDESGAGEGNRTLV